MTEAPSYEIEVRVKDRDKVAELLNHVCGTHTSWRWVNLGWPGVWIHMPVMTKIMFTGEKCKAAAAHFKLSYEEPSDTQITFLGGISTSYTPLPFSMAVASGKSSILFNAKLVENVNTCVMCDIESTIDTETWLASGTDPQPSTIANAASELKDSEST